MIADCFESFIKGWTTTCIRNYKKNVHKKVDNPERLFKQDLESVYDNIIKDHSASSNLDEISNIMSNLIERAGIGSGVYTSEYIKEHLFNKISGVESAPDISEVSTDKIFKPASNKKEVSKKFLTDAYGEAIQIQTYVENETSRDLFDCLFINRDSKKGKKGSVTTTTDLNNNMRQYKENLFTKIITYLRVLTKNKDFAISSELKTLLNGNCTLFKSNGDPTYNFEALTEVINRVLDFKPAYIQQLYQIINDSQKSQIEKDRAKIEFEAYNAKVMLSNIDTYIALVLPKTIKIKTFNKFEGGDNYLISDKTAQISTNWRRNENINPEKEVDTITKFGINTTRVYAWQSHEPISGKYLSFQDFEYIIAKIKRIAFNPAAQVLIFDRAFFIRNSAFEKSLSREAKKYLFNKSLSDVIGQAAHNSRKCYPILFEIFSNPFFYNITKTNIMSKQMFRQNELDKLWSLSKEIFVGEDSLNNLSDPQSVDYFSYITQAALSVCDSTKIQIYTNPDNQLELRELKYASVSNIRRKLENKIDVKNSFLSTKFQDFKDQYKIIPISDSNDNFNGITFLLNGNKIKVSAKYGSVTGYNPQDLSWAEDFISETLSINLQNDIDFRNALIHEFSNEKDMLNSLFKFASRVLLNRYVSYRFFENTQINRKQIESQIKTIFSEDRNSPNYNYALSALGKVSRLDIPFLSMIARAQANVQGILTAVSAKDSNGNGQSLVTLSRLIGNIMSQISLQEKLPDSATKDCILLKPGMLEDAVTVTEYYDVNAKITKPAINMNPTEMITSQLFGFQLGLSATQKDSYVGNGHVLFYTSTNSDKPQLTAIKVDLNTVIEIDGTKKSLKNLTEKQLYEVIAHDFYTINNNIFTAIVTDLNKINKSILSKFSLAKLNYNDNFENFNRAFYKYKNILTPAEVEQLGNTPAEFLKRQVLKYNLANPTDRIELVDQMHIIQDKQGNIHSNACLLGQLIIFNSAESCENFFKIKEKHMLAELLKQNVTINLSPNNEIEQKIISQYNTWIDSSGDLIFAKIKQGNNILNITSKSLIYYKLEDIINQDNIELNPLIKKYNLLDFIVSQEFMHCSVGTFLAHPIKFIPESNIEDMALRVNAQNKRNVSITATVHPFELNTLNGQPDKYKVATIEDIFDKQSTVLGINETIKVLDGATFVDPFSVILENNSLKGAKVGITKKQFIHFKNPRLCYAGIIKTAGFGLTNDWIRNSELLQHVVKKMTNGIWRNEDGSEFIGNILQTYNNTPTQIGDLYYKTPENGKYWHILSYNYNEDNGTYNKIIQEVNEFGDYIGQPQLQEDVVINNNFDLWQFLGGWNSVSFKESGKQLVYSNSSVEAVVRIMNQVGTILTTGPIKTQEDVYQPLKHSNINYLCTNGAIKQGAANINPAQRFTDEFPLDFQEISLYQAGVQLDKEHYADEGELSLLTQLINACAVQGFSFDQSTSILQALRVVSEQSTKDVYEAFIELGITGKRENMRGFLTKTIVKILANSQINSNNFASILAEDIINSIKRGKDINFKAVKFPFSDRTVFAKVLSSVTSFLTKTGIKQKIPGLLSVLTPSYGIFKLYAGRKLESFSNPEVELEEIQKTILPTYDINDPNTSISRIRLGRNYIIQYIDGTSKTTFVNTAQDYWELVDNKPNIASITEDVRNGRDLASFNVRIITENGEFQIWDLDSFRASYELEDLKKNGTEEQLQEFAYKYFGITDTSNLTKLVNRWKQKDLINLSAQTRRNYLQQFIEFEQNRNDDPEYFFNVINQWLNIALANGNGNIYKGEITITPENYDTLRDSILNDLQELNMISINGQNINIDPNNVEMEPYEAIAPKIFKTEFGLKEHDDLFEISRDPLFFVKRIKERLSTKINPNLFEIELKKQDGNHIYITDQLSQITDNDFQKVDIYTINEDGKTYRTDEEGNILYELYTDPNGKFNFNIYQDSQGNEIIVTDNILFYLNNLSYDYLQLSSNISESKALELINLFKEQGISEQVQEYVNDVVSDNDIQTILELNKNLSKNENYLYKIGKQKHASFLKQLEVIVGRIPGQGLQSFMPMQIVAFDNPDINTLYVSTMQILLQGSDYDIDTASIVTYDISSNGLIPLWSPYAKYNSLESLNNVMRLPFPTGKKSTVLKYNDNELINDSAFAKFIQAVNLILIIDEQNVKLRRDLNTKEDINALSYLINNLSKTKFPSDYNTFHEILGVDINLDNFINQLSNIVDTHNLYFDKCSKHKIIKIANNYSMYNVQKVNTNPAHLIQAGTSVDRLTGRLKDKADESEDAGDIKTRSIGDFIARAISIMDNQVGKIDVGITANGLKAFFNSTQYLNEILNTGTKEQQESILFNINILGKTYSLFSNLWPKNINTIKSEKVFDALSNVTQDEDSSLLLSAMLSLSVDNAKELKIAYLNASPETMGMYLAGLMIGMDFDVIADVFMSPVGKMLKRRIQSNIFHRDIGKTNFDSQLFDFFDNPFTVICQKFNQINFNSNDKTSSVSKLATLFKVKHDKYMQSNLNKAYRRLIYNNMNSDEVALEDKLDALEKLRSKYSGRNWNQLIDFLEQYEYDSELINQNPEIFDAILQLSKCQTELYTLGRILSLNQGLKSNLDEMQGLLRSIEGCIENRKFDIIKFFNDEQYAIERVQEYGESQVCINILGLMKNVPHINKYAQILAMAKAAMNESFTYRSVNSILDGFKFQSDRVITGVQNFVNDTIIDGWLLTQGRDIPIVIPKGVIAYDKTGSPFELKEDTPIQLGTDWGNATFRSWMESRVIPNLQKGNIQPGVTGHIIKDNIFIRDLTPDILTSYITRNQSVVYTLPIKMIPKTDNESILLDNYRDSFSKITAYSYKYIANNETKSIPLLDLFTYYTMISFRWRNGENSLVPIFAKFTNSDKLSNYRNYIVALDRSNNTLTYDEVQEQVNPYIIPFESPWTTKSNTIYYKNKATKKYEKMTKSDSEISEDIEDFMDMEDGPTDMNGFTFQVETIDYNMFPKGTINDNMNTIYDFKFNDNSIQVQFNKETENIEYISLNGKSIKLKENIKVPFIIQDGIRIIDEESLNELIETNENCS